MSLRRRQNVDLETYRKFYDFRDQQFKVLDLLKDIFIREQKKSQLLEHDRGIFNLEYKLLQGEKTKIVNPLLTPLKCLRLNIEQNRKGILDDIVVQAEPEPLPIKDRRFQS
jgi:hypothetical protein